MAGYKWPKGTSGNPDGRPKKPFTKIIEEIGNARKILLKFETPVKNASGKEELVTKVMSIELKSKNFYYGVIARMYIEAMSGDIRAAEQLMDRREGKPIQGIEINEVEMSHEELAARIGKSEEYKKELEAYNKEHRK